MATKSVNSQPVNLPFVGREKELAKFRELLDKPDVPWLMWVIGSAGQGKSKLLEACLEECEKRKIHHSGIIDFFNDGLRTRWGVITELAKRFHVENDEEYKDALNQYQTEVTKGDLADPNILQFSLNRTEDALINAICPKRRGRPRVIFVDTVEEIVESLGLWFFEKFLTKLYPHFRVIAGGRKVPAVGSDASFWKGQEPYRCELTGLNLESVRQYLQETNLLTEETKLHVADLHRLTGGGQALLVALACIALHENRLEYDELDSIAESEFLKRLVIDPHNEKTPENFVILELAHVYHGYTPDTLKLRYSLDKLNAKTYDGFLEQLRRFPYIKYHADTGTTRLHDYFRERLSRDLWTVIDPDLKTRADTSRQLADYFAKRILEYRKKSITETPELDTLRHQWLYHLLFADREIAYGELWDLLDVSWHAFKYDYMDSLLDMAQDVNEVLRAIGKYDKVLKALENSARVWMGLEIFWDAKRAIDLANEVLEDSGGVRRLELTAKVAKSTALGRLGEFEESVKMLREAYKGYNDLLMIAQRAEKVDEVAQKDLLSEHGIATVRGILPERYLILNTIGVLLRNRGHYDEALREFEQSFDLSKNEGDLAWKASATTQIGTALRYKGEFAQAYDRIHQGLAWRKKAGQRGREAFSINALGMLQRDEGNLDKARVSFNEAYNIWRELRAEVDMASVLRNLGWIDYLEGDFDLAQSRYVEAEEVYLRKGLRRELPNLRQKQGALWVGKARVTQNEVRKLESLRKAETLLQEGLSLGDQHNQPLYSALCLVDLSRIAEMRGDYEKIPQFEKRLRKYEKEGYHFEPAYADLEEVLGKIAEQKATKSAKINHELFDKATDHYCQMFVYLARYSSIRYRQRREFLREWLPSMPDELRHRACKRLIECWQSHPDLATAHPGFVATVKAMDDL